MHTYDALPAPLRSWLSGAVLPWSPASVQRIWNKSIARGLSVEDTLSSLSKAEERTLQRDLHAHKHTTHPPT